jgi:signal transduction histidine kinase
LAIVAEIVRHHGATIRVESTAGGGTTFIIAFPEPEQIMLA